VEGGLPAYVQLDKQDGEGFVYPYYVTESTPGMVQVKARLMGENFQESICHARL
jgi:hypothetical protein